MSAPQETPDLVSMNIDGQDISARSGKLLIDACEEIGVEIPRFCYHKRMSPVGMCRMCIVEVDTGRGPSLQPSCMLTVSEGMVVDTQSELTKKVQDGVLEFLLLNHPLDCPVCDKGGECPLQDQTIAFGPGETRFVEEKRHFEKPIPINENVFLDRERCILCDRCTRFAEEVVGDPLIQFIDRGNSTEVNTFPDDPFSSYFSGNVVQICPVGALTAKPYRFKARPWDLEEVESTYPNPMGDRIVIQSSRDQVLRLQGLDSEAVNWGWLSDKDRFSFEAFQSEYRLDNPLVRGGGLNKADKGGTALVATTWAGALSFTSETLKKTDPNRIAFLGGARMTNESQYAWAKLAKGIIGTDHVSADLGDELPPHVLLGLPRATISEICQPNNTVLLLTSDLKEEHGTLYIRLRHAAKTAGVNLIELSPTETGLSNIAAASLHPLPGEVGSVVDALVTGDIPLEVGGISGEKISAAREYLTDSNVFVIVGRSSVGESTVPIIEAISSLQALEDCRFLPLVRRGNTIGALDMGMSPGLLPGRNTLGTGSSIFSDIWPNLPSEVGADTKQILKNAADGQVDILFLLGADPITDFPDPDLAKAALKNAGTVIAVDLFVTPSVYESDVVLPAASFLEVNGSHTNIEGRISPIRQKVTPPGTARPDWMIASEIAHRLGGDLGIETPEDIWEELVTRSAVHGNLDFTKIDGEIDGHLLTATGRIPFNPVSERLVSRPFDSYSMRLVVGKKMFDQGTVIQMSQSLRTLAEPSELRINLYDFERLGIEEGTLVKVSSGEKSINIKVKVDNRVPRSSALIYLNLEGADPRDLLVDGSDSVDIRIDPTAQVKP
ncbi:MAG: NADH-quinone oxidoreductase subunit NuoG [Acidimicrobiales bacterium]|nr:NADH-quinone oxidoreductase subunit NuoG [Acidimicrobiales bacterium]